MLPQIANVKSTPSRTWRIAVVVAMVGLFVFAAAVAVAQEQWVMALPAATIDLNTLAELSLETAQRFALAQNPDLAATAERVRQAQQRVQQARAAYWPTLDSEASARRVDQSDSVIEESTNLPPGFGAGVDIDDTQNIYTASLITRWTVFDGFRRHFSNLLARYGAKENEAARQEARRLLLLSVADAYYLAQLAKENIAIAKADEAFNQRQVDEAKARRRVGTGSLSDVLNFEVQVNAARSRLNDFQREYEVAMIGLASLLGLPQAHFPAQLGLTELTIDDPRDLAVFEADRLIDYALQHRSDLSRQFFAMQQAEAGVGIARSVFFPEIELGASLDGERTSDPHLDEDDFGTTVGVFMTYRLYSGGRRRAELAEAKHRQREAQRVMDATRIEVASEVQEAIARVESAQRELLLQRRNASLVQRNRDLVEKEYNAGQASLVRLNEAQRDLIQAQGRLALARVGLRQTIKELEASTGQILVPFAY